MSKTKKPKGQPARGLNAVELRQAIFAAFENGVGLLEEAELLYANGRYARAGALAAIGMTEIAKGRFCIGLLDGADKYKSLRDPIEFWDSWLHHQKKGDHAFMTDPNSSPLRRVLERQLGEKPGRDLEQFRMLCFYSDIKERILPPGFTPSGTLPRAPVNVWEPTKRIQWPAAESIIRTLREFVNDMRPMVDTVRSVGLKEGRAMAEEIKRLWDERFPDRPMRIVESP